MIRPTRLFLVGIALLSLVGLGACSDGEDASEADPPDTTAPEAGSTGDAVDCAGTPGDTVTVVIPDFEFDPGAVQVNTCDQIVWSNEHDQSHTSTGNGDFAWSTGNITPGTTGEPVLFDTAGEFAYMCALHPFMKASVTVS